MLTQENEIIQKHKTICLHFELYYCCTTSYWLVNSLHIMWVATAYFFESIYCSSKSNLNKEVNEYTPIQSIKHDDVIPPSTQVFIHNSMSFVWGRFAKISLMLTSLLFSLFSREIEVSFNSNSSFRIQLLLNQYIYTNRERCVKEIWWFSTVYLYLHFFSFSNSSWYWRDYYAVCTCSIFIVTSGDVLPTH